MSYSQVGKVWDAEAFKRHVASIDLSWAKGVTLHHTAAPSLAQRPQGLKIQHLRNLQHYYEHDLGWSAGPHLFVDEDQIYGLSPMTRTGTHARSFNKTHIGIEVLGDYDQESPTSGRGLQCWQMAAAATSILLASIKAGTWNFHRDDPKTSKTCPGGLVTEELFAGYMEDANASRDQAEDRESDPEIDRGAAARALDSIRWQLDKLQRALGR